MPLCQPCKVQGKHESATNWCLQCNELFCMACTDYHKVLKLTRDHMIITYKEYDHVLDVLPLLQTTCKTHSDKDFKYLCKIHDTLCCGTCKISNHSNCEIEKLEAIAVRENVEGTKEVLFAPMEHRLRTILDIRRKTSDNIKQVDCLRELVIDINQKKKQIYELLNSLDAILTNSLNDYEIEKQHLQLYEDDLSKRHTQLRTKRDKLISLLQLFGTSSVYRLILQIQIKQQMKTDEIVKSKQLATVKDTNSASRKILNINELRACLELFDRISNSLALMTSSLDFDLNENSSSTVEVEKDVVNIGYANNADGVVSSAATKSNNSSNFIVTSNKNNPQVTTDATKSSVQEKNTFKFQSNFRIEKKKSNIAIRCVKVLPYGHIIIGESSEPRLMIYAKEGCRKSEMKLEYGPESIAIIDSGTIAVTMSTMVLVVNVTNSTYSIDLRRRIEMQDDCYGLTYVDNMLVVNCKQSGLKLVSLDGCTKKIFRSVTGILHICSDLQSNIWSVKRNSECIRVFNLSSESVVDYISPNMCDATGITADSNGNVFVTCDRSETVYFLQKASNTSTIILSKSQNIDCPWNLDYDEHSGELVIINNGGKSVYVYKKQLS